MIDLERVGKRIAFLRKERKLTGEALAELLEVSPQAVSKWENARCLPETSILPALAEALNCSIDSLLCPRDFFVLEAVYTDGETNIPMTHFVENMVRSNGLCINVNESFLGVSIASDRLKMLTVKFQTPEGIFFSYALENHSLVLDKESVRYGDGQEFRIIDAYYGNEKEFSSALQKMKHYEYFKWDKISVNHETFPSSTASDDVEYLTLVYLNAAGIHVISCPENETVYYGNHRTSLYLESQEKCILKDVMRLDWGQGMECPWAGSLYAALKYMREPYTYHQIMGMSGACWRVCFTDVWDYSCTDALVAFDYATPLFRSLGYSFRMADRVEKQERKAERLAVMRDIRNGKPVLAINLRVAPEWGVITGYTQNGARFLCRTYFDKEVFDVLEQNGCGDIGEKDLSAEENSIIEDRRLVFEDNEGYLFNDFWPFLLIHFGEKEGGASPEDALKASLSVLSASFHAPQDRGYYQGKEAYEAWMRGLAKESDFRFEADGEKAQRRLCVNDSMISNLIDSRRAAASYLSENADLLPERERQYLAKMADNCRKIAEMFSDFQDKLKGLGTCEMKYNTVEAFGAAVSGQRKEQSDLLKEALALDEENCQLAQLILDCSK